MALHEPTFRLIVGLGNPGRDYSDTRHNIGFMVLDRLAEVSKAAFRAEKKWRAEIATTGNVCLSKPLTYMNLSGESVGEISRFYKIPTSQVVVILDDLALPFGKLRFRSNGSAGGHNGLQSVIDHLGTNEVARLRVGIGAAAPGKTSDYVLGGFSAEEKKALPEILNRAAGAIQCAQTRGLETAMNQYNQSSSPAKPAPSPKVADGRNAGPTNNHPTL